MRGGFGLLFGVESQCWGRWCIVCGVVIVYGGTEEVLVVTWSLFGYGGTDGSLKKIVVCSGALCFVS